MSLPQPFPCYLIGGGGTLDAFQPSRGIRQRDPLPPYIFILCMEIIGALISEKCEANQTIYKIKIKK